MKPAEPQRLCDPGATSRPGGGESVGWIKLMGLRSDSGVKKGKPADTRKGRSWITGIEVVDSDTVVSVVAVPDLVAPTNFSQNNFAIAFPHLEDAILSGVVMAFDQNGCTGTGGSFGLKVYAFPAVIQFPAAIDLVSIKVGPDHRHFAGMAIALPFLDYIFHEQPTFA